MFSDAFSTALRLIVTLDPELVAIVVLSLQISLSAVAFAALIGLPLGALVAVFRFPGRGLGLAVVFGIVLFCGTLGGAIGPFLAGRTFDVTGSYQMVFLLCSGLAAVGLILISLLRPPESSRS